MQMNKVIHSRRRALGLTQEQVADALGVTAPAVNKWEKGATCPDVTLLAPLARLLGIDLNELMGFHENLSDQEVQRITMELVQLADRDGLDAAFALAKEQLRRYPNSDFLVCSLATVLQGLLSLSANGEAREAYEQQIIQWHERAAASGDPRIRDRALWMLASYGIRRRDWDAAQRAIDALPERQPVDRRVLQAQLCSAREQPEEAARLLEEVLLFTGQELSAALLSLSDAEIAAGDLAAAGAVAKAAERIADCLDQWSYIGHAAPLQVAIAEKNVQKTTARLRQLMESIDQPWKPAESPLYHRIATAGQTGAVNERILAPILNDLRTNPTYDFLRGDAEFAELLDQCQPRDEQA